MFKYLICKPLVLADDSHEISYLIYFFLYLGLMSQNVSSVAVVIGALTVNPFLFSKQFEPDKAQHNLGLICINQLDTLLMNLKGKRDNPLKSADEKTCRITTNANISA